MMGFNNCGLIEIVMFVIFYQGDLFQDAFSDLDKSPVYILFQILEGLLIGKKFSVQGVGS